jgi:hypothetical protein
MTDQDDSKRRIGARRKKTLFELREQRKEDNKHDNNYESCRLEEKNDIESHHSIMGSQPNYLIILYIFVINYKQILMIFLTKKLNYLHNHLRKLFF